MPSTIKRSPAVRPDETSHWSPMARLRVSIRCWTLPASSTTRATGSPFGIAAHPLLRHQDGLCRDTLLDHGPHEHARQEQMFRIRDHDPQGERPGRRVHRDIAELQGAFQGIRGSVLQKEADFSPVGSIGAEPAGFQIAFQTQQVRRTIGSHRRKWDRVVEWLPGTWADTPSPAPRP